MQLILVPDIYIQENTFETAVCKMSDMSSPPKCMTKQRNWCDNDVLSTFSFVDCLDLLCTTGYGDIWVNQGATDPDGFLVAFKCRLHDVYSQ